MGTFRLPGSSSTHAWTNATGRDSSGLASREVTRIAANSLGVPKADTQLGIDSRFAVTITVSRNTSLVPGKFPITLLRVISVVQASISRVSARELLGIGLD
jgi:hypothetical protein